jgi:hypothetical protein
MTLQHDFVDTSLRLLQGGLLLTCQFAERLPDPVLADMVTDWTEHWIGVLEDRLGREEAQTTLRRLRDELCATEAGDQVRALWGRVRAGLGAGEHLRGPWPPMPLADGVGQATIWDHEGNLLDGWERENIGPQRPVPCRPRQASHDRDHAQPPGPETTK